MRVSCCSQLIFGIFLAAAFKLWLWACSLVHTALRPYGVPLWVIWVASILALAALLVRSAKQALVKAMPSGWEFIPARPEQFAWLDHSQLGRWTVELESLGFEKLGDITATTDKENVMKGFARIMAHPQHYCYAEMNQGHRSRGESPPLKCAIESLLDDNWSLATTNRRPTESIWLLRRMQNVWSTHLESSPTDLLKTHLETRNQMEEQLGIDVRREVSLDTYIARETEYAEKSRELIIRKPMLMILAESMLFHRNPQTEWRGAWAAEAKKRSRRE